MTNEILISMHMPIMALRGLTVFPSSQLHFDVGREKSIQAVEEAMAHDREIFLVTQKDIGVDDPGLDDLYAIGTICRIKQMLKLPGDNVRILVEGLQRGFISELQKTTPYLYGSVESIAEQTLSRRPVWRRRCTR